MVPVASMGAVMSTSWAGRRGTDPAATPAAMSRAPTGDDVAVGADSDGGGFGPASGAVGEGGVDSGVSPSVSGRPVPRAS